MTADVCPRIEEGIPHTRCLCRYLNSRGRSTNMAANSNKETNATGDGKWYPATPTETTETDQLLSFEKLDRASPDLWPEQIPGVSEYATDKLSSSRASSPPKWMAELENDDINLLQEFGSLTTSQLMEKVRGLQNLAYQLGLDEAREMTRGKFLQVLQKPKRH